MLALLGFMLVTDHDVNNMGDLLCLSVTCHQEILSDVDEDEKRNSWSHECF